MLDLYYSFSYFDRMLLVFISMLFCHFVGDYLFQKEFLAKFKQRKSWEEYDTEGHYKYDYIVILLVHAFSWAVITYFPLLIESKDVSAYFMLILINTGLHAYIDDLKANKLKINLITDQLLHLGQIVLTIIICIFIF